KRRSPPRYLLLYVLPISLRTSLHFPPTSYLFSTSLPLIFLSLIYFLNHPLYFLHFLISLSTHHSYFLTHLFLRFSFLSPSCNLLLHPLAFLFLQHIRKLLHYVPLDVPLTVFLTHQSV